MIWYACYGSNMDESRFLKYIQGGSLVVNGKTKEYHACPTDTLSPRQTEPYVTDRKFFFGKESNTWDNHGVGFISNKKNKKSKTFGKLYLISENQFTHLFAQENSRRTCAIDFNHIIKRGFLDFDYNFYNRIILLNKNYKGFPILTFTHKNTLLANKPHSEYVRLISNGLKSSHNFTKDDVVEYLSKKGSGINKKELRLMISEK